MGVERAIELLDLIAEHCEQAGASDLAARADLARARMLTAANPYQVQTFNDVADKGKLKEKPPKAKPKPKEEGPGEEGEEGPPEDEEEEGPPEEEGPSEDGPPKDEEEEEPKKDAPKKKSKKESPKEESVEDLVNASLWSL